MLRATLLIAGLFAAFSTYASGMLDMNFSNDSVRARYGQDFSGSPQGRKQWGVGMLYNTDDNVMFDTWITITDEAGSKTPGLDVGVGPKIFFGKTESNEYLAVGIGGLLFYRPVQNNRIVFSADAYIAPGIVTFLDADNVWEVNIRMGYEIMPSAIAYISWRQIRANFKVYEDEEVVDRGAQVGLEMRF